MSNVTELRSVEGAQEFVKGDKVVVKFSAPWCGPCQSFAPAFEQTADAFAQDVRFGAVCCEEARDIAVEMRVRAVPTVLMFVNGEEVARLSGKDVTQATVETYIKAM